MSKPKVYIDGREGTTGLQIYDRLAAREDIQLLLIDGEKRKDTAERKKFLNAADLVFLCLPDAAAVEAVGLIENENTRVIDCSTAHRVAPGWVYGFPELLLYNAIDLCGITPCDPDRPDAWEDAHVDIGGQTPVPMACALEDMEKAAGIILYFLESGRLSPEVKWAVESTGGLPWD